MKNILGKMTKFLVDGVAVQGIFKEETPTRVIVQTDMAQELTILKGHLSMFWDAKETVPLHLHKCFNNTTKCSGVSAIFRKDTVGANDLMIKGCPNKCATCILSKPKSIYDVDNGVLIGLLDRKMFGDYPQAKEKKEEVAK